MLFCPHIGVVCSFSFTKRQHGIFVSPSLSLLQLHLSAVQLKSLFDFVLRLQD